MNEQTNGTTTGRKRRIRAVAPPQQLQTEVARKAKIIRKHAEVLGPLGMQAIQIATLQVVAGKLEELRRLMAVNGVQTVPAAALAPALPPRVQNACVLCGRPGNYQMRTGTRGWYCAGEHANWARGEDGEELMSRKVSPSTQTQPAPPIPIANQAVPQQGAMPPDRPVPTPGLANALRMLQGDET